MKTGPRAFVLLCLLGLFPAAIFSQAAPPHQPMGGTDATFNNATPPAAVSQPMGGALTFQNPPPPPPPPPSNPDTNPVPPAPVGVTGGINGAYQAGRGPKGNVTCTAPTSFNTFFQWPISQGNPADHYNLTIARHGTTVAVTRSNSDIICNSTGFCTGYLNLSVAQVQGLVPEINWATSVWDHLEWTNSAHTGIAIFPWMMNSNVAVQACNSAGSCSSSTSSSMNLGVFSNGQRDCQAQSGGAPAYNPPNPMPPPGSVR